MDQTNSLYEKHKEERQNLRLSQDFKKHNWLLEKFKNNVLTEKERRVLETLSEMSEKRQLQQIETNTVKKKPNQAEKNITFPEKHTESITSESALDMPVLDTGTQSGAEHTGTNITNQQPESLIIEVDPIGENINTRETDTSESENQNKRVAINCPPVAQSTPTASKQNTDTGGLKTLKDYFTPQKPVPTKHKLPLPVPLTIQKYRKVCQPKIPGDGNPSKNDKNSVKAVTAPVTVAASEMHNEILKDSKIMEILISQGTTIKPAVKKDGENQNLKSGLSAEDHECIQLIKDKGITLDKLKQIIDSDDVVYVKEIRPPKEKPLSDESVANLVAHSSEQKEAFDLMKSNQICNKMMIEYFEMKNALKGSTLKIEMCEKKINTLNDIISVYKAKEIVAKVQEKSDNEKWSCVVPTPPPPPPSPPPPPPPPTPVTSTTTVTKPSIEDKQPTKPVRTYVRRNTINTSQVMQPSGSNEDKQSFSRAPRSKVPHDQKSDRTQSLPSLQRNASHRDLHTPGFYRPNPAIFNQTDTSGSIGPNFGYESSYHTRNSALSSTAHGGYDINHQDQNIIPSSLGQNCFSNLYGHTSALGRHNQRCDMNHSNQTGQYNLRSHNTFSSSVPLGPIGQNHLNIPVSVHGHNNVALGSMGHYNSMAALDPFGSNHSSRVVPNGQLGSNSQLGYMGQLGSFGQLGSNSYLGPNGLVGPNSHVGTNSHAGLNKHVGSNSHVESNNHVGTNNHIGVNSHIGLNGQHAAIGQHGLISHNYPNGQHGSHNQFGPNRQLGSNIQIGSNDQRGPNAQNDANTQHGQGNHTGQQGSGISTQMPQQRWLPAAISDGNNGHAANNHVQCQQTHPVSPPYGNTMPEHLWSARDWPDPK